jgi:hypothetical protein
MNDVPSVKTFAEPPTATRGVRLSLIAVVFVISGPNASLAMDIQRAGRFFGELLNGKPLPAITEFVLHAQPFFIALSLFIPLVAVATFFVRRLDWFVYLSCVLILTVFIQMLGTWQVILLPFLTITMHLQG